MEIVEVEEKEFISIFSKPYHVYGSGEFTRLNRNKVDDVFYLLFKDRKIRFGLTGGVKRKKFKSPFSAPFGGFISLNNTIKIDQMDMAITALIDWAISKGFTSLDISIPPSFYNENFIGKQSSALYRSGFVLKNIDLNYHFLTRNIEDNYFASIWHNARKNLKRSLANKLSFHISTNVDENFEVYKVIKKNREQKGYPLRMSWEQVRETSLLIKTDFFFCVSQEGIKIASAIVFYVSEEIVQVIYWGDLPDYNGLKPMNFLSFKIFEHYQKTGVRIVDIGPSTENSIPNFGLCEFKESIGCSIQQKQSFTRNLT